MRTSTRWLMVGASVVVLVGGALTVAAATEGSREVPGGPGRQEHQNGAMLGDVDQIHDRDETRLRDGSCLEAVASDDGAVPAGEAVQERTRARERTGERHQGCACLPSGETNRYGETNQNAGTEGPQQEQERNGSGPYGSGPSGTQTQEQAQTQEQEQTQTQTQIQEQEQEQEQTQTQEQGGNTAGTSGSGGRGGA